MKKTIIALAAGLISFPAYSQSLPDKFNFSLVSDSEYNIDAETTTTEFGAEAEALNVGLSVKPTFSWDDTEITNIEFGVKYDFQVTENVKLTPYGEYNTNKDFDTVSKIVGVKSKVTF